MINFLAKKKKKKRGISFNTFKKKCILHLNIIFFEIIFIASYWTKIALYHIYIFHIHNLSKFIWKITNENKVINNNILKYIHFSIKFLLQVNTRISGINIAHFQLLLQQTCHVSVPSILPIIPSAQIV